MKKLLILSLFLCLLFGTALYAQTDVIIGNGTDSNGTSGHPTPYGTYYKNFRQQYLYTASDIEAAGGGAGPINSLAFNVDAVNTCSPMPNFTIRIKETTQTELTDTFETGTYTDVFFENDFLPVAGWNVHTFSNPWTWDGSSNILVDVITTMIPGSWTQNASVFYTPTAFDSALRYHSDSEDASTATGSSYGGLTANRANIKFNMTALEITDPPDPAGLVSPADGTTLLTPEVTLNWVPGSGLPTGYKIYFGTDNPPSNIENGTDLGNVLTYDAGILPYSNTYYWQIVPYNDEGDATGCPIWSFTTMADPTLNAPVTEEFSTGVLPTNWTLSGPDDWAFTGSADYGASDNGGKDPGTFAWVDGSGNSGATDIALTTPPISLAALTDPLLKFGYFSNNVDTPEVPEDQQTLKVDVFSDGVWTNVFTNTSNDPAWQTASIPLAGYVSPIMLRFAVDSGTGSPYYDDILIDDVMVIETPAGPMISVDPVAWDFGTVIANSTTAHEFTITNIGVGSLDISSIAVTGTGFALTEAFTPVSLAAEESSTFSVNFAPLSAGTFSGSAVITDNRGITTIPLDGEALDATIYAEDLPHPENFDSVTAPEMPLGWETVLNSTNTYAKAENRTAGTPNSAPNHIYMYNSGDTSAELMLISPPIDVDLNTLRVKFYGKGETDLNVFVGTYAAGVFTNHETLSIPASYAQYAVDFSGYAGTDNRIAFMLDTSATYRDLYIDDVVIEVPAPNPPEPATVVFPLDGMTTLVDPLLKWSPSATGEPATSYVVYMNQTGTFGAGDIVYTGEDLQYQTSGLDYTRTYYWKVEPTNTHGTDPACPTWDFTVVSSDQLAENFEDTTFPPAGWANGSSGNWTRSTTTPNFEGSAQAYKYTSTSNEYQLSTPMVTIYNGDTLDFWTRTTNTSQVLQIAHSQDRETWTQVGADITYAATGVWYQQSVDLSSLAGDNYYLAFYTPSQSSSGSIYVDYVVGPDITPLPPGPVSLIAPADVAENQSVYPSFSWNASTTGGVPTGYNLYLDTTDGSTLYASDVTSPYTPDTALAWDTTYYWTVEAYNNTTPNSFADVRSFTTMSDPTIYTMPWLEDFGTTGTTFPPDDWFRGTGLLADPTSVTASTAYWIQDNWRNDTTADPVNYAARMNIYSTNRSGWLITPPIQMPGAGYQLDLDIALTDYANFAPADAPTDDRFIILIGDGTSWTPANVVREWNNTGSPDVYDDIPHTGEHVTILLDGYTGVQYIAFYGESIAYGGDNDFFVDNVMIRLTPAGAPHPVTLDSPQDEADGLDINGFDLSWTPALTGGDPETYTLYMSDRLTNLLTDRSWTGIETTSFDPTQADVNPLNYNYGETWYWTVRAYNTDGDSLQVTPYSFTIMPDPRVLSLPYTENFDSVPSSSMPAGWTGYVDATSSYAVVETSTSNAVSSPNSMYLYNSGDSAADLRLISPEILVAMNTIKLSFSARGSTGYTLLVGTVDAIDETGTFNQLASFDLTSTHTVYNLSLADYDGTDQYICFKHGVGGTYRSIYIDDVQMDELVDTDMAVVSLTGMPYGFQNTDVTHTVTVMNNGTEPVSDYTVYLRSMDSREILGQQTFAEALAANDTNPVEFTWTPTALGSMQIYAEVFVAGDAVAENNESDPMTFDVLQEGSLIESFEGGVIPANWTVLNVDGGTQVWNAQTVNPHTGSYAARVRYESYSLDNDDWLITPPLQVTAATTDNISFWMRSYSATSDDPWQVLISTTDTNPASFTMIDEGDGMMADYVQKSYNLDSYGDAILYLAVRYIGAYDWYLYVDDFVGPPIYEPETLAQPEVTVSTVGDNVRLDWDAIPFANSYDIYVAETPDGPFTLAGTVQENWVEYPVLETKLFAYVVASTEAPATRSIVLPPTQAEQEMIDARDRAARTRN